MKKNNKGFSLIEILVSLAIASIIILSITQLIINAVRFNKKSEDRQQTALVGQQIIEEIKTLSDSNINTTSIRINDDLTLTKNVDGNSYNGVFIDKENLSNKYDINVTLKPVDIGVNQSEKNIEIDDALKVKLDVNNDILIIKNESGNQLSTISLNTNETPKIIIEKKSNEELISIIDNKITINENKILIDFNGYKCSENLEVNIYNYTNSQLTMYTKKTDDSNIKIRAIQGSIKLDNNPVYDNFGYLYTMTVKVEKDKKLLFEGYINKNLSNKI